MTSRISSIVLSTIALGVLATFTPDTSGSAWAAAATNRSSNSSANTSRSTAQNAAQNAERERTAVNALGRARYAAQNNKPQDVLDQIERAETALLNVAQAERDPHVVAALQHVATARMAVANKNLRAANAELAAATRDLTVSLATLTPPGTLVAMPLTGDAVYGADGQRVGEVTEIIFEPDGDAAMVVISVGDYLGTGEKNVAVPITAITVADNRDTIRLTKDQLQQAPNYRLPTYGG